MADVDVPSSGGRSRSVSRPVSFFEDSEDDDSEDENEERVPLQQQILNSMAKLGRAIWRSLMTLQLVLFFLSIVLAVLVFMPLSLVTHGFREQCLLFSNIVLTWNSNYTVSINLKTTHFGDMQDCELATFISVTVAVACMVFAWFYLCNIFFTARETKQAASRIQVIVLLIFLTLLICALVAASKLSDGFDVWCRNIENNHPPWGQRTLKCYEFEDLNWTNNINAYLFYTRFVISEVSSWLLCTSLFLLCCVTCIGCYQMSKGDNKEGSQTTLTESLLDSDHLAESQGQGDKSVEDSCPNHSVPPGENASSSGDADGGSSGKNLFTTQATIHPESQPGSDTTVADTGHPGDSSTGGTSAIPSDGPNLLTFPGDFSDPRGFSKSERIASRLVNSSGGDEEPATASKLVHKPGDLAREHDSRPDMSDSASERRVLARSMQGSGGYGAVNIDS